MPFHTVGSYAGLVGELEPPSSQMQLAAAMSSLRVSSTSSPSAAPVKLITENLVMFDTSSMNCSGVGFELAADWSSPTAIGTTRGLSLFGGSIHTTGPAEDSEAPSMTLVTSDGEIAAMLSAICTDLPWPLLSVHDTTTRTILNSGTDNENGVAASSTNSSPWSR